MNVARFLLNRALYLVAKVVIGIRPSFDRACGKVLLDRVSAKGERCRFEGGGILIDPQKLRLGNDVYIGRNFFIRATGGVSVGSYTHISRNVTIHTVNHNIHGELLPYDRQDIIKPTKIGRYVWIGMNVNVLPGVTIGDGAVIGMGTTVARDVDAGQVVVGLGQRCISCRDPVVTQQLVSEERFLYNEPKV